MRATYRILALLLLARAVPAAETNLNTVTSVTGQFLAVAPGPILPSALCVFAEHVKRDWRYRLDLDEKWRDPIVLAARPGYTNGPPVTLAIIQTGPLLKYEINCRMPADETALTAAVVESLCLERANRDRPRLGPWQTAVIPLWLTTGLAAGIQGPTDRLTAIARRAGPIALADLLRIERLPADEPGRDQYRAQAWLLTESVLRLPAGSRKVVRLFTEPFTSELTEETWHAARDRLMTVAVPQNFTGADTARRLAQWLELPDGKGWSGRERDSEQAWFKDVLRQRLGEFPAFYTRAHPLYRPVIQKYREAGEYLVLERISRYRATIRDAEKHHAAVDEQMRAINAALDAVERTQSAASGTNQFEVYFRAVQRSEQFEKDRRNPISDYLDKFEK